jgi:putative oxidoreductase
MIDMRTAPLAATLLRVALGGLFLAHAALKLFVFGPAGTVQYFASLGFPPLLWLTWTCWLRWSAASLWSLASIAASPPSP